MVYLLHGVPIKSMLTEIYFTMCMCHAAQLLVVNVSLYLCMSYGGVSINDVSVEPKLGDKYSR